MDLVSILDQFQDSFMNKYANQLLPSQLTAINAMRRCRTPDSGELYVQCSECDQAEWRPMSCGHRSCPKCQNHEASKWLDRQRAKLLPVEYFMVTFTLPYELRSLAWHFQSRIYAIMFTCAISTLKDFGLNPKHLGADMGMTAVLHTNNRKLEQHPHIHIIVPGGGIDKNRRQWKKLKGEYLFNGFALARVFRARFLTALNEAGLPIPVVVPKKWVSNCKRVGTGLPALKYLSRYLYRGVIAEKNIRCCKNGKVTFSYVDSETGKTEYLTLAAEDFIWRVLQHVLPRGFRRVRDYGFLHGNAKKILALIQLVLRVVITLDKSRPRPVFKCPKCKAPMTIAGFRRPKLIPG
jgi:hypothetical protein